MELEPYGDTSCGDCSLRSHHTLAECEAQQAKDAWDAGPDWDAIEAETKRQHEAGIHKQCDQMDCYTCWWEQTPAPTRVAADGEWPKRHVVRPGPVVNERYDATATYVLECGHTMGAWG